MIIFFIRPFVDKIDETSREMPRRTASNCLFLTTVENLN